MTKLILIMKEKRKPYRKIHIYMAYIIFMNTACTARLNKKAHHICIGAIMTVAMMIAFKLNSFPINFQILFDDK